MAQIWGQSDLLAIFPIFVNFGNLSVFLVRFTCPVRVDKNMVVILTFFIFLSVYFELVLASRARRKALMSV